MGRVVIGGSPYLLHAGPAIDELSLSPGSAADAGHSEGTARAQRAHCSVDWIRRTVLK